MLWTILQSIILGIIQGATEFIPISSSGHLIIVPWLFGWNNPALSSLPFDVSLHLGTLIAVLVFFWADWVRLVKAGVASLLERKIGADPDRRLAWFVLAGTIPGGIAGALLESTIENVFHRPNEPVATRAMIAIAVILAFLGALLLLADKLARHLRGMDQLTWRDALLVGLSQAMAIFPGVSRSGATITTGLALGLKRETAARFSFLLSAPIIAGAGLKSLVDIVSDVRSGAIASGDLILFPIGFLAAAISGYLCIRFLLSYLQRHNTNLFVYYRWVMAAVVIVVALARG